MFNLGKLLTHRKQGTLILHGDGSNFRALGEAGVSSPPKTRLSDGKIPKDNSKGRVPRGDFKCKKTKLGKFGCENWQKPWAPFWAKSELQRENPNGRIPMGEVQRENSIGRIPMRELQRENSKATCRIKDSIGKIPKDNVHWDNSKGKVPMGKFQWET